MIAIPTTAGTGSEANPYSVLSLPDGEKKKTYNSNTKVSKVGKKISKIAKTTKTEVGKEVKKLKQKYKKSLLSQKILSELEKLV